MATTARFFRTGSHGVPGGFVPEEWTLVEVDLEGHLEGDPLSHLQLK